MINICETCRHRYKRKDQEPCGSCRDTSTGEETNYKEINYTNWEPMPDKGENRIEIEIKKRPEMLPRPFPIYERTDSEIPERIRISFTNGTSAIYDLHTDQPAPVIVENVRIIRKWKQGYINQPMRRRRYRK